MKPRHSASVIAVLLTIVGVGCASPSATRKPSAATHTPLAGPRAFTTFAGFWYGHGSVITINSDGSFTMSWRTYQNCGQAPQPCDTMSGNTIIDGGKATGRLTSVSGIGATGSVARTNQPQMTPVGPIKIELYPNTDSIAVNNITYCGIHAPAGYCGA